MSVEDLKKKIHTGKDKTAKLRKVEYVCYIDFLSFVFMHKIILDIHSV